MNQTMTSQTGTFAGRCNNNSNNKPDGKLANRYSHRPRSTRTLPSTETDFRRQSGR